MITTIEVHAGDLNDYVMNIDAFVASMSDTAEMVHLINAQTLQPIFTSRSILNILGYTQAEIKKLGPAWARKLVHPEDYPFLSQHILNLKKLRPLKRTRVIYRVKDKHQKWFEFESISTALSGKSDQQLSNIVLGITRKIEHGENVHLMDVVSDHRCMNCRKLLGKEKLDTELEVKCSRCGEFNTIHHH